MDMEHQADIDSCFSYHKDFEKVIGKGTINILPKSDFKFQMQKQLDVPVSAVQNGLPTTRDLGSFGNIQIAQSERSRTYLCFSNHMTEYAADQEYIYNNFVYESLKHVMPAANLQRVTHDARSYLAHHMVGRPLGGLVFPSFPVDTSLLKGFSEKFRELVANDPTGCGL
ncbi:hypothetical protein BDR26DRAFT_925243 [Obelidium mucronatum]|nr:hypothetical protein BDR26DRAFT_925243 [Obelidium mucronatum]